MMTRRQMNNTFAVALAAFFSGGASEVLQAKTPSTQGQRAQEKGPSSITVSRLLEEPLAEMPNPEVSLITLNLAPGATSDPHRHTGPVFAYILEGSVENQVDPEAPQTYQAGQFFYEPPLHVHRSLRNLSKTQPAKILVFGVGEKGKQFTISAM
ncbi:MAG: cupin domain-containing protein [Candidatus Acidiferrales bacterium]